LENKMTVYGEIIRLLVAAACALFVLSLPLSKTEAGATLRRWAGVCFILAFLPSLVGGVFYPAPTTSTSSTSPVTTTSAPSPSASAPGGDFFSSLGCFTAFIIAAYISYGILKLRSRFASRSKPRDPWESFFNRGGGKRPFTMNPKTTRSRGPFGYDDEDDD
jgi:hypothetical protein